MKLKAFTLIEILIAIAIIGAISTMTLNFKTPKRKAKTEAEKLRFQIERILMKSELYNRNIVIEIQNDRIINNNKIIQFFSNGKLIDEIHASEGCYFKNNNSTNQSLIYTSQTHHLVPAVTIIVYGEDNQTYLLKISGQGRVRTLPNTYVNRKEEEDGE